MAVVGLSYMTWNTASKEVEVHDHSEGQVHSAPAADEVMEDLDAVVEQALESMAEAEASGDMMRFMNDGIQRLLAVVKQDPNHEKAIYHLGLFSIKSGQLEKAEKRFEKLILLQPENQEYQQQLTELRKQLEK